MVQLTIGGQINKVPACKTQIYVGYRKKEKTAQVTYFLAQLTHKELLAGFNLEPRVIVYDHYAQEFDLHVSTCTLFKK